VTWWPGSPAPRGEYGTENLKMKVRLLSKELTSASELRFELYKELVCRYNHRDLTYLQDVLRAFSGVLNAFVRGFPDGFVGGLPARFLGQALSWQPFRTATKRVEVLSGCAQSAPLPSWSWAGWQCLVDPKSLHSQSHGEVEFHMGQQPPASLENSANKSARFMNTALLPCTTTTARFRVRRVLVCREKYSSKHGTLLGSSPRVEETDLCQNPPEVKDCCPVITLEDDQRRWAGLLRVMDENSGVEAGQTIQTMALSQDNFEYSEAAATYEAEVDSFGCHVFDSHEGPEHCHFESTPPEEATHINKTSRRHLVPYSLVRTENEASGLDQGPFFYDVEKDHVGGSSRCPNNWLNPRPMERRDKMYSFYNMLWVENRGGVMYRKAAGRISKEIWQQNCGVRERMVLG
jgi:hypothetical protein